MMNVEHHFLTIFLLDSFVCGGIQSIWRKKTFLYISTQKESRPYYLAHVYLFIPINIEEVTLTPTTLQAAVVMIVW